MELDHLFICVEPGAGEAEELKRFGITEGTANQHPGQGTANRRFFFQNAFIEFLFLVDPMEAQSDLTRPTKLYERLKSDGRKVSPFGIGFRPDGESDKRVPFPSWSYKPNYFPEYLQIDIGKAPLEEPMWFFVSFAARPDKSPVEMRQPLVHDVDFKELTSVRATIPGVEKLSLPGKCAAESKEVEIVFGEKHLIEIGFDNEDDGQEKDFRPLLPLVFRW